MLCRIWQHLTEITTTGDVTAILTTHYIEEARQANQVNIRHEQRSIVSSPSLRSRLCVMDNY